MPKAGRKIRVVLYLNPVDVHRANADATHLERTLSEYFTALLHHRLNIAELKAAVPYIPSLSKKQATQAAAPRQLSEKELAEELAQDKVFAIKSAVDQYCVEHEPIEKVEAYLALWGLTLEDAGLTDAKGNGT